MRLEDGSTIEMKDRSEVSLRRTLTGTTLHLDGGSVIIEATNKTRKRTVIGKLVKEVRKFFGAQDKGDFFVETNDSLVSVTGTTFAVNAGTKGSRVSVIEGEVHLDRNGSDKVLRAGDQATTNAAIETIPVKDEVAWSRNAARYSQVLEGLAALRKDLNAVAQAGRAQLDAVARHDAGKYGAVCGAAESGRLDRGIKPHHRRAYSAEPCVKGLVCRSAGSARTRDESGHHHHQGIRRSAG